MNKINTRDNACIELIVVRCVLELTVRQNLLLSITVYRTLRMRTQKQKIVQLCSNNSQVCTVILHVYRRIQGVVYARFV